MSLRSEQYRSLSRTRELLRRLQIPSETPRVPTTVREEAGRCLSHFPYLDKNNIPRFSKDPFGPDEIPGQETSGRPPQGDTV